MLYLAFKLVACKHLKQEKLTTLRRCAIHFNFVFGHFRLLVRHWESTEQSPGTQHSKGKQIFTTPV